MLSGELPVKSNIKFSNRFADGKLGLVLDASVYNNPMESHAFEAEWDYSDESNKDATAYLSNRFPQGILVVKDGFNTKGKIAESQNFKIIDWRKISGFLK